MGGSGSPVEQAGPPLTELRDRVRRFLREEIDRRRWTPQVDAWQSAFDPAFSRRLAERGWLGLTVPKEYGGHGASDLERYVVVEELLAAGAPVAAHWIADRQMVPGILRNGTEAQKHRYLPGIVAGERYFGIGMSEPEAGSDLASIRTRATRTENGWVLGGAKVWTTGAHLATNLVVLARTDPAGDRHAGLSQFLLDLPHPRIEIRPIVTIDRGHHFNEVIFHDAVLPPDALLGEQGRGWRQVTAELANERSGPERLLCTFVLLDAWARRLAGRPDPAAHSDLAGLVARLGVLRQMSLAVAVALSRGQQPTVAAAMVKDLGTVFENDLVECIRFHCGEPDPDDPGLPGLLAQAVVRAPAFTLRGGTNEILRSIVAKEVSRR